MARNWKHFKDNANRRWVQLSDEQLEVVAGNRDQLAGKIQEVYGTAWQSAQKESSPFK